MSNELFAALGGVMFIWLLVTGVSTLVLLAQSAALLTLWRSPSRVRKLGLVSLGAASLVICVMFLPFISSPETAQYAAYALWTVNVCYFNIHKPYISDCSASVATQHSDALALALTLLTVIGFTSVFVIWAFRLKAREPRHPLGPVWLALVRLLVAFIGALVSAFGGAMVVNGVLLVIDYWVNSPLSHAASPEHLEGLRLALGLFLLGAGAVVAGVGALVLWLAGRRRRAPAPTVSTAPTASI